MATVRNQTKNAEQPMPQQTVPDPMEPTAGAVADVTSEEEKDKKAEADPMKVTNIIKNSSTDETLKQMAELFAAIASLRDTVIDAFKSEKENAETKEQSASQSTQVNLSEMSSTDNPATNIASIATELSQQDSTTDADKPAPEEEADQSLSL